MTTRLFSSLFLILSLSAHSQTSTKELIDSLNRINDHQKKMELSRKIALRLQKTDWDRAIKYIELAEGEAIQTEEPEPNVASVYITAGKMYTAKEVFDVALKYYLNAYDIYKDRNDVDAAAKVENNLAIIYSMGNNKEKP